MPEFTDNSQNNNASSKGHKAKKFVFHLYGDNVDFIDSLPMDRKNQLINELVHGYKTGYDASVKSNNLFKQVKKVIFIVLLVIVAIPLLIKLVNFSVESTLNSYGEMQRNFEKLFD
jgi:hypothetical protein